MLLPMCSLGKRLVYTIKLSVPHNNTMTAKYQKILKYRFRDFAFTTIRKKNKKLFVCARARRRERRAPSTAADACRRYSPLLDGVCMWALYDKFFYSRSEGLGGNCRSAAGFTGVAHDIYSSRHVLVPTLAAAWWRRCAHTAVYTRRMKHIDQCRSE